MSRTALITRGFGNLRCPLCGKTGVIAVLLDEVTNAAAMMCRQCSGDFNLEAVRNVVGSWKLVLDWLDKAPVLSPDGRPVAPQKVDEDADGSGQLDAKQV